MNNFGNQILNDLAKMAGGGVGLLGDVGRSMRQDFKARIEELAVRLDLVPREDFESVQAGLESALSEIKALRTRLDRLEGKKQSPVRVKKPVKKSAPQKKKV